MLAARTDAPDAPERGRLGGLTLLVAEDDLDARELLCEFFSEMGATCLPASSGNQAFAQFIEKHPDILISDVWMPDGDGFELVRRIRALPPEQGGLTPALAVSAASNTEEALMAGYHALIAKPYDPSKIVEAIEDFFGTESQAPPLRAAWTASSPESGTVVLTFVGHVRAGDMRDCIEVLLRHLEKGPCDVIADFRKLTGFSVAAASVAERAVWPMRQAIRRVCIVGGPKLARLVATGACRVLGLRYSIEDR
jgi:CheY-like chemotaxis protein